MTAKSETTEMAIISSLASVSPMCLAPVIIMSASELLAINGRLSEADIRHHLYERTYSDLATSVQKLSFDQEKEDIYDEHKTAIQRAEAILMMTSVSPPIYTTPNLDLKALIKQPCQACSADLIFASARQLFDVMCGEKCSPIDFWH